MIPINPMNRSAIETNTSLIEAGMQTVEDLCAQNRFEDAIVEAYKMSDDVQLQSQAFVKIVEALCKQYGIRLHPLEEAIEVAKNICVQQIRSQAFVKIVEVYCKLGHLERAKIASHYIEDAQLQTHALAKISELEERTTKLEQLL